jgi:hypothetical protein
MIQYGGRGDLTGAVLYDVQQRLEIEGLDRLLLGWSTDP